PHDLKRQRRGERRRRHGEALGLIVGRRGHTLDISSPLSFIMKRSDFLAALLVAEEHNATPALSTSAVFARGLRRQRCNLV
ncbi:hypothetical protein MUK42_16577, partial [Musa troglodytarum]